jgi:hypothetical protein
MGFLAPEQITQYTPGNQLPMDIDFDGVEQLYFRTGLDLRSTAASGLLEELTVAEDGLAENGPEASRIVMLEEEMASRPEPDDTAAHRLKLIRTITRKRGLDMYQFRDYWHNHHKVTETGGIYSGPTYRINVSFSMRQTIRVSLPEGKLTVDDGDTAFDGFMDIYWLMGTSVPAVFANRPFPPAIRRDERNFIDLDAPLYRAVVEEYVVASRIPQP